MKEFTGDVTLVTHVCVRCGILFALPKTYDERRKVDYADFYCPNGHALAYIKPTQPKTLPPPKPTPPSASMKTMEEMVDEISKENIPKVKRMKQCPKCFRKFKSLKKHYHWSPLCRPEKAEVKP